MSIRWSVPVQNKDIAGFYVVVRDQSNKILVERHVSYEVRRDSINGDQICDNDCNNLEICILSKNSYGSINGWFDSQCKKLPKNFKTSNRKNQPFVIYSQRTKTTNSTSLFLPNLLCIILFVMVGRQI